MSRKYIIIIVIFLLILLVASIFIHRYYAFRRYLQRGIIKYWEFIIDENDIDYQKIEFLNDWGYYDWEHYDELMEYMKTNNLRIKEGSYKFSRAMTFEEALSELKFKKIRNIFDTQFMVIETFAPDKFGLGSADISIFKGGWELKNLTINAINLGCGQVFIGQGSNYIGLAAIASVYSSEITYDFGIVTVGIGADLGAIGVHAGIKNGELKIGAAYGVGGHIIIRFN